MQTTKQWWNSVKVDSEKMNDWLVRQYRGEVTASARILRFSEQFAPAASKRTLEVIARQEQQHAEWVLGLLKSRNIQPAVADAEERYWRATLPQASSFETGAAIGAHAEAMRLERIREIVADEGAPVDVREVFKMILKDEIFHERAFRSMAGQAAMQKVEPSHRQGLELLGLEP